MGINYAELQKKMENAGDNGVSKFNMRNETKQHKFQPQRIKHLKKEKKKKAKLCFVKEIAIPFNPMTGKDDETYNADSKWRPPYSVESVIKLVKSYAESNDDVKKALMRYAGVSKWEIGNANEVTQEDYDLFKNYLTARIFSIPAVHVTIPSMCGGNGVIGRDYTVDVKIDPKTGDYIGEVPLILQAHKFFIELAYEELTDYNEKLKNGEIKHDEKQQKEYRQAIFSKVPVSDLAPINFVKAFEIPLNARFGLEESDCLSTCDKTWVENHTVLVRLNKTIFNTINDFVAGDYIAVDRCPEYFVVDMSCPSDTDVPTEIGLRTKYEKEMFPLSEMEGYENFRAAVTDYLDNFENLEETVFRSSYVSKYDSSVDTQLLEACGNLIDIENPFLTKKVFLSNERFLMLALGEKADKLKLEIECDMSDKVDGNLDSVEAAQASKVFDIESTLNAIGDVDDVPTEQIKMDEE